MHLQTKHGWILAALGVSLTAAQATPPSPPTPAMIEREKQIAREQAAVEAAVHKMCSKQPPRIQYEPPTEELSINEPLEDSAPLEALTFIRTFRCGQWFKDSDLVHLRNMTCLEHLSTFQSPITDAGIASLRPLTKLKYVLIQFPGNMSGRAFAAFPSLENLEINYGTSGQTMDDSAMQTLGSLKRLQELEIYNSHITGVGLAAFSNLKQLAVRNPEFGDTAIAQLYGMPHLSSVDFCSSGVTGKGFCKLKGLKQVRLNEAPINDAGLREIASLPQLESLDVSHTRITDQGLKYLSVCKSLKSLNLGNTGITGKGLASIAELKQLKSLGLADTKIDDRSLACLENMTDLQDIGLGNTTIGDEGVSHLIKMPSLQSVWMRKTRITDAGLAKFAPCKNLSLYVGETAVTKAALKPFQQTHPRAQY